MNTAKKDDTKPRATLILERAVLRATGENADAIRAMPVDERRRLLQKDKKAASGFISKFPLIGRGNVLRDRIKSRAQIDAELDEALRR